MKRCKVCGEFRYKHLRDKCPPDYKKKFGVWTQ